MKLKKLSHSEPQSRLAVSVKSSTFELLEQYRIAYEKTYGVAIGQGQLVDTLLRDFITSDKDFMKSMQEQAAAPAPAPTPAPAPAAAKTTPPAPSFGNSPSFSAAA